MNNRLAYVGFGEVALAFACSGRWGPASRAFDIAPERSLAMASSGVRQARDPSEAVSASPLILSLVTANQSVIAANACAAHLDAGAIWCDMNSVAPRTKKEAAKAIEAGGGHYVDIAIMAPVNPAALSVPLLLSGNAASSAASQLRELGFTNLRIVGSEIGQASAIKMIRSVMVKGIEALTAEMVLAADAAGVADEIYASLDASEKVQPWAEKAAYNLERMITHGQRRADEMEEVAKTLAELGVVPVMTEGAARRQREMAATRNERKTA